MNTEQLEKVLAKALKLSFDQADSLTMSEAGMLKMYLQDPGQATVPGHEPNELSKHVGELLKSWQQAQAKKVSQRLLNKAKAAPVPKQTPKAQAAVDLKTIVERLKNGQFDQISDKDMQRVQKMCRDLESGGDPNRLKLATTLKTAISRFENSKSGAAQNIPSNKIPATQGSIREVKVEELFNDKPRKAVNAIGGIRTRITVRQAEVSGSVQINGDIPEECLLVVKNGNAKINGMVFGHLLATGDITVTENVQGGWIVSTRGDISVDRILVGTHVVSMTGDVACSAMEFADTAFAWKGMSVSGDVIGGTILAGNIKVDGKVAGAELHSIGSIEVSEFEVASRGKTVVCLRDVITCNEYGHPLEGSPLALKRSMGKSRYQAEISEGLIKNLEKDSQDCFRTMLYYLIGGTEKTVVVQSLRSAQSEAIYIDQLVVTAQSLRDSLQSVMASGSESALKEEVAIIANECVAAINTIRSTASNSSIKFSANRQERFMVACRSAETAISGICKAQVCQEDLSNTMKLIVALLVQWRGSYRTLLREIDEIVTEFGMDSASSRRIEAEPESLERTLNATLEKTKSNPNGQRAKRARQPVMRLMQKNVERNHRNIEVWTKKLEEAQKEIANAQTLLTREALVLFGYSEHGKNYVTANAFSEGVAITTNPLIPRNVETLPPPALNLSHNIKSRTTFMRRDSDIVEAK